MTSSDGVGPQLVIFQWLALVVLALLQEYHARRAERDNRLTRENSADDKAAILESNKAVIAEIRLRFPRWFDEEPPDEEEYP